METIVLAAAAYTVGAFLLAAMVVRLAPDNYSAHQIRKHLILFLVVPFLLFIDLVRLVDSAAGAGARLVRALFELVSGRRLYRSVSMYYRYPKRLLRNRETRALGKPGGATARAIRRSALR